MATSDGGAAVSSNASTSSADDVRKQLLATLKAATKSRNQDAFESTLVELGSREIELNNYEQARTYLATALRCCNERVGKTTSMRVHAHRMLGCIALESEMWDDAKSHFMTALETLAESPESLSVQHKEALERLLTMAERRHNPSAGKIARKAH